MLLLPSGYIRPVWILILAFLLVLPRFNRHIDWLESALGTKPADDVHYVNLVKHARCGAPPTIRAPFAYRFLIPYAASVLPFDPFTSINTINLLLWVLACGLMYGYLARQKMPSPVFHTSIVLFTCSFPAFYYTAIGYIDTWPLLCAAFALRYAAKLAKPLPTFLFFSVAVLGKESSMAILPFLVAAAYFQKPESRKAATGVLLAALAGIAVATLLARGLAPSHKTDFVWLPNLDSAQNNLLKTRTLPTLFLGLGIQGLALVFGLFHHKFRQFLLGQWPLTLGFASFLLLWAFALVAAYADARPLWPAMVFSTALFGHYWSVARYGRQGHH